MFFAFPLNNKPDWRHPPWMTLLLIAVNCFIFFGPQAWEEKAFEKASNYYLQSQLPRIELPRYANYLRQKSDNKSHVLARKIDSALAEGGFLYPYLIMSRDKEFTAQLDAGLVIQAANPDYQTWKAQRTRYLAMKGRPFTTRWASDPSNWDPISAITATFLHGSTGHLLGNMVFLFLFGYTVEKALGPWRYLTFYLLAGIGGELGDLIARWGSPSIGLGASGAISGLMAMYVVLYGKRKIKFFYQFLIYFDYVMAPAIILLPLWLAHEFFQQWLGGQGVAYMAHAGGFITGALLITWQKYFYPDTRVLSHEEEKAVDPLQSELDRAQALLKAVKIDEARTVLAALTHLPEARTRLDVLAQYFNLARLHPASNDFHRAARLIFALDGTSIEHNTLVHETFRTYLEIAKPSVQFTPEQLAKLALRFAREGYANDAVRLAKLLSMRAPEYPILPKVLLSALNALRRQGQHTREGNQLLEELQLRFPETIEAKMAQQSLN